jgi:DNA processing protein
MSDPHACLSCLRRSQLLALLAPYIERALVGTPSKALDLLALDNEELAVAVEPKLAPMLLERIEALDEADLREELEQAHCWACCRHDERYPPQLRQAADAPWALIGRGDLDRLIRLSTAPVVTVVGSRRATSYGREVARQLGSDLAASGVVVLSGLAFGIDACAHRGALDGGLTAAVLGCGPDIVYPAAHRSLWRRIGEEGLVLSELPPGAAPWRWTFPARNRIMAALGTITVVVEAAQHSGSLLTARLASGYGRQLGAVPGPVNSRASAGPNALLAEGSLVVRGIEDLSAALALAVA